MTRFLMRHERYKLAEEQPLHFLDWRRANMSLLRKTLLEHGGLDENFTLGYFDDGDLGARLEAQGIKAFFLNNAYAYVWSPESLPALKARYYDMGYSLLKLTQKKKDPEIARRFNIAPSSLRYFAEALAMPFYLRACRHPGDRAQLLPRVYRGIFEHDLYTGFSDAQNKRPIRKHHH